MILTIIHMINQLTKFTTTVIITTKLEMKMIMPAVMTPITALDVMMYIFFYQILFLHKRKLPECTGSKEADRLIKEGNTDERRTWRFN